MAIAINQQIQRAIKADYNRRVLKGTLPKHDLCIKPSSYRETPEEFLVDAAFIYSSIRKNSSFFALLLPNMCLKIISASGILAEERYVEFPADDPKLLMSKALGDERLSVHVPDISNVVVESIADRVVRSSGTQAFGAKRVTVELIDDVSVLSDQVRSSHVISMLPLEFSRNTGSVLLTPLGLEKSTRFGFGFIYEYKEEEPFSSRSIQDARTYSAFFMQQIAEGLVVEQS